MELQNKPYGLLSIFAFILAGGAYALLYIKKAGSPFVGFPFSHPFDSRLGYLVIFFVVIGCMLAAASIFAKKNKIIINKNTHNAP